jgi:guanosine-3',5'-bis(diphosphate) 3'-pyrophosphohydrolase
MNGFPASVSCWIIRESNALDFIDDFKLNLFADEIFVFTPSGEIKTLPVGSTASGFCF